MNFFRSQYIDVLELHKNWLRNHGLSCREVLFRATMSNTKHIGGFPKASWSLFSSLHCWRGALDQKYCHPFLLLTLLINVKATKCFWLQVGDMCCQFENARIMGFAVYVWRRSSQSGLKLWRHHSWSPKNHCPSLNPPVWGETRHLNWF